MIIAKYKFNPSTYADYLPEFNSGFSYTKSDTTNSDGTITRTIESSSLPTLMRFGELSSSATDRSNSLLEILDMNTSNLTSMANMFARCTNLTSIMCNWDTSQVTDMHDMFNGCGGLVSLDVSNFNTSKVTNMRYLFEECPSLTQLNVSNWNTSQVTTMQSMFGYCSSLTSLDLNNWNTSKVTNMNSTFQNCSSLTSLDLNNWDTSKVINMSYMFKKCSSLTQLGISNWDTSQVTDMNSMFYKCDKLTTLDVSNWNISKVIDISAMFQNCSSLTSLDVSNWDVSNVTNMRYIFGDCSLLTLLNISNWNASNVTDMTSMFDNCRALTSLDISNFNTSNVTDIQDMFRWCTSLRKVNLKYANESTVSKIHENLPDRSSTTKGYILSLISLTSDKNWEALKFSHNEVYLPQPLRKIGDIKDRFYWDYDKGHYCIEQNVGQVVLDGSKDEDWNITGSSSIDRINTMAFRLSDPMMGSVYNIKCDKFITCSRENSCYSTDNEGVEGIGSEPYYLCLGIKKSKLPTQDVAGLRQWLSSNPTTVFYVLEAPVIIDLPEMNKKLTFDTYLPNTSIDATNLPLQPYKLLLEDDTVRYKSTIEPSTLYTIQFNCLSKLTTNLTLDLGGTRVTVDPIIGVNHVQITTPSVLASDRLFLIGTGIIVNEVIVSKGDMRQYTKYFDGEQSVGELQEDGSYIIRISTDNYTDLWEGDL